MGIGDAVQTKKAEDLKEVQKLIDGLKQSPQFAQYVAQHKLKLIDSRLAIYDRLLDEGLIR